MHLALDKELTANKIDVSKRAKGSDQNDYGDISNLEGLININEDSDEKSRLFPTYNPNISAQKIIFEVGQKYSSHL